MCLPQFLYKLVQKKITPTAMYVGSSYIIRVMHSKAEGEFHNTPDGRIFNFWCCLPGNSDLDPDFLLPPSVGGTSQYPICNFFGDLTVYQSGSNDSIP